MTTYGSFIMQKGGYFDTKNDNQFRVRLDCDLYGIKKYCTARAKNECPLWVESEHKCTAQQIAVKKEDIRLFDNSYQIM